MQIDTLNTLSIAVFSKNRPSPLPSRSVAFFMFTECVINGLSGLEMEKVAESNCSSPMGTISTPTPRISEKPVSPTPYPSDYLWSELERYLLLLCLGKKNTKNENETKGTEEMGLDLLLKVMLVCFQLSWSSHLSQFQLVIRIFQLVICVFFYLTIFNHFDWICLRSWRVGENGEAAWDSSINQVPKHHRDCVLDGDLLLKLSLLFRTSLKKMSSWVLWG